MIPEATATSETAAVTQHSPPSSSSSSSISIAPPKRRACDECRARKLACSKQPDGCDRCRREAIPCRYSPQKPMGRPRKRRQLDRGQMPQPALPRSLAADDLAAASPPLLPLALEPAWPRDAAALDIFGPDARASTAYLDLLPAGFGQDAQSLDWYLQDDTQLFEDGTTTLAACFPDTEPAPIATRSASSDDGAHQLTDDSRKPAPSSRSSNLSTAASSPDDSSRGAVKAMPSVSCACLSSLYLAVESLSRLPADVASAMRVARQACKVAQDVVECRFCFNAFFDDPLKPPPIQSFQNLTFLGALVPSACNAYASILEMIGDEAAAAKSENRLLFFSMRDVGGPWHALCRGGGKCCAMHGLDNKLLKPDAWQRGIMAVLRRDVHGQSDCPDVSRLPLQTQKSLKDVLIQLDQTSRRRHEIMDELTATGQAPKHSLYLLSPLNQPPCPPEQRSCVKMMETARMALDRLTIA